MAKKIVVTGFWAGLGGFALHLLIYCNQNSDLPVFPYWLLPLGAWLLAGVLLCASGRTIGERLRSKRGSRGPNLIPDQQPAMGNCPASSVWSGRVASCRNVTEFAS